MNALYIAAAIPVFFLMIGAELWVAHRRGVKIGTLPDSISSLACGTGQQVTLLLMLGGELALYVWLYENARVFTFPGDAWWTWLTLLVLLDMAYYWAHRASHRVNFLWATHVVHHQSEEYNLATALRQSWLQGLAFVPFYAPLAILGFDPVVFVAVKTINTLYQFWIHTRLVGKLGPLEWVLNTASHHRVHHAIDPVYIDKNYAGMFIVWDKLFGTFVEESVEPHYGTVKPLNSWNAVWANVDEWMRIARHSARTARWTDKVWVWFAPPEWRPADLGGVVTIPEVDSATRVRYAARVPPGVGRFVVVQFGVVALAVSWLLLSKETASYAVQCAVVTWILAGLGAWGGLFESRVWARPLEWCCLVAMPLVAWLAAGPLGAAVGLIVAVGSAGLFRGASRSTVS